MNKDVATALGRLDRYLDRVKRALRKGELVKALADVVELSEIARRLSVRLEHLVRASYAREAAAEAAGAAPGASEGAGASLPLLEPETRQETVCRQPERPGFCSKRTNWPE
jgi:hypothetical protein